MTAPARTGSGPRKRKHLATRAAPGGLDLYFSDHFGVPEKALARHGAFNVSLVADLPLFIDPFLLFNSRKRPYTKLHDEIIRYLRFLRDKATDSSVPSALLRRWYAFPEIRQNWLGFSRAGNRGSGLGKDFAGALHANLNKLFGDFGAERVTRGSHLEKLCLISDRVGRDKISDFTTNLIHGYLLEYTQALTRRYVPIRQRRRFAVDRVRFNYRTESWERRVLTLPNYRGDYVLLTPADILTKDDTWINRTDLVGEFDRIPRAIPNDVLRQQVSNYFLKLLPRKPVQKDRQRAAIETIRQFPQLIDYYIRDKENRGAEARSASQRKVDFSRRLYVEQFGQLARRLAAETAFYSLSGHTYAESLERVHFLKDVIENKGGHRLFYVRGVPLEREEDIQILYRLTWFAAPFDVSREVNDGRGPADFKVSRGAADKTLVEFKLASNSHLKKNLQNQLPIYQRASDAKKAVKAIIYFSADQLRRVTRVLRDLRLEGERSIVLIDARANNKPSGSKA